LFSENGQPFKEFFTELGGKLVDADLIAIGLKPD
jgi:hypothetical protein